MSTIFHRHPRFTVVFGVGILVVLLLQTSTPSHPNDRMLRLYRPHHAGGGPHGGPPGDKAGPSDADIAWRLKKSEEVYQGVVKERANLIKKFGPTKDDILPWPKHREFYTLWDFFIPAFNCPHETDRVGILGDGGKWMCGLSKLADKRKCTIYSFGINDESSFEAGLLERTNYCEVWGYDFSVKDFGPEVREIPRLASRSHFKPWGLSGKDDHSADPPMYTLQTLMKMNGHNFIDILKVDIEGFEFPALKSLIKHYKSIGMALPFGQLQLEIHADRQPGVTDERKAFKEFLDWWEQLEGAGLRPFWTEPNLVFVNINLGTTPALAEYSFLNIKADHEVLH